MPVPFFSSRQLAIELTEPVVILRGHPSDPTTDLLRGEVELVLNKPTVTSSIQIKLVGKSRMLWPEGIGARGTKLYHEKTIHEQTLLLQPSETTLPAGLHRWSFEFLLSNRLAETIEDEMAKVFYYVTATVHRVGTYKLRCQRNILVLRTLTWSDFTSQSLRSPSIIMDRRLNGCDANICIESSIASSGTQFPIALTLLPHAKHVQLEAFSAVLTERRVYRLPEYNARRAEMYDFKLPLTTATDLLEPTFATEIPFDHLRKAVNTKVAHIPIQTVFQHRLVFTLPGCINLNHTTTFKEIDIRHYLKLNIEISAPSDDNNRARQQITIETPITILDCRLKDDYSTLPTYEEALMDPTLDHEDEKPTGFFICPCYLEYRKKRRPCSRQEWLTIRQHLHSPPPPPYEHFLKN
ncbi:hypothetical protein DFQ28_007333 [Apophysomyces sp. BC1034]|nr:hypothetical protein DFQ30_002458 [Apophysomyces sp. BC1015]KAG0182687.1 hypothetical protein DFQ29_002817 [Apophysomyces sp. BC1021]KAG0192860.1 hypothetical protein DFQ28_007333 [Apophysomyces sp. BC1034]